MGIDWFTFCAQIINFLILVWLLKKVLYKPVLDAMAAREAKIASRMREADEKADLAQQEQAKYLALRQQLRSAAAEEMQHAKEEADRFRDDLLASVRREVEDNRMQWMKALTGEKEAFLKETNLTVAKGFHKLANNTLRDLAGEDLEKRILTVFLAELGKLSSRENDLIKKYIQETGENPVVTSAFSLSESLEDEITQRLQSLWGENFSIGFRIDESLLAGIHIEAGGKKIQWDAGNYLNKFASELAATLERETFTEK